MKKYWLLAFLLFGQLSYANDNGVDDCIKPTPEISVDYQECLSKKGFARVGQIIQTEFGGFPYPLGLIDKTGKVIVPVEYYRIDFPRDWEYDSYSEPSEALILLTQRDISQDGLFGDFAETESYGLVNEQGEFIVPMGVYDEIGGFSDGLAMVKKSEKYGFMDSAGKIIIPMIYDNARLYFKDGFLSVKKDTKFGIIDKQNNIVIPFDYDYTDVLAENLFKAERNDKYALLDGSNKPLTNFEYDMITSTHYLNTYVVEKDNKYGLINDKGKLLIDIKYDDIGVDFEKTYANDENKVYFKASIDDKELSFDEFGRLVE